MERRAPAVAIPSVFTGEDVDLTPEVLDQWDGNIRNAVEDKNAIDILEVVGPGLFSEGITAKSVTNQLRSLAGKDVTVNINSPGGSFLEGLGIYNALRTHDGRVTVNILGMAASVASVIAMAGDDIRIAPSGFVMIHNTHGVVMGNRHDLADMIEVMEQFDQSIAGVYAARTGTEAKTVSNWMDKETLMSADLAKERGFADALLAKEAVTEDDDVENRIKVQGITALRRLDTIMARAGVSRTERRTMLKDVRGTRNAADEGKPSAALSEAAAMLASIRKDHGL